MSFAHTDKVSGTRTVEVFSIKDLPVTAASMNEKICFLDEIERFEANIAKASQDIDAIRQLTKDNEDTLIRAMNCQYRASLYSIKKLPAIVIDKEYVAYGVDTVSQALAFLNDRDRSNA